MIFDGILLRFCFKFLETKAVDLSLRRGYESLLPARATAPFPRWHGKATVCRRSCTSLHSISHALSHMPTYFPLLLPRPPVFLMCGSSTSIPVFSVTSDDEAAAHRSGGEAGSAALSQCREWRENPPKATFCCAPALRLRVSTAVSIYNTGSMRGQGKGREEERGRGGQNMIVGSVSLGRSAKKGR